MFSPQKFRSKFSKFINTRCRDRHLTQSSLTLRDTRFRMTITLGVVLIRSLFHRSAVTLPLFWEKDISRLSFRFCRCGGDGVEEGLETKDTLRGSFDLIVPTSEAFCHSSTILIPTGGVKMSKMVKISGFIEMSSF